MAKPDKSKLQRITNFDFSAEGCHVAIVDKAANGKEQFLVVKNLGSIDKEILTLEQEKLIINLCIFLKNQYNINKISGHCDYSPKTCPGNNIYKKLNYFKEIVFNDSGKSI